MIKYFKKYQVIPVYIKFLANNFERWKNMTNMPEKFIWDNCLDEPIPKGEEVKSIGETTQEMKEWLEKKRAEDYRNEKIALQQLKNLIIK